MEGERVKAIVFEVSGDLFALEASCLKEILWLPQLDPVEEAPFYQPGIFDLRGEAVSVADLNLRFYHPTHTPRTDDLLIIFRTSRGLVGVVANRVVDLLDLDLLLVSRDEEMPEDLAKVVVAEAKYQSRLVMLLDPEGVLPIIPLTYDGFTEKHRYFSEVSDADMKVFFERAQTYSKSTKRERIKNQLEMVVVTLHEERFAFVLGQIIEFAPTGKIFPIPMVPEFVLGNINLRGDVVTVFDISHLLGLPFLKGANGSGKVVVFEVENQLAGIRVDEVHDVRVVSASKLQPLPLAIPDVRRDYLLGEIIGEEGAVLVVDAGLIFETELLVVDDPVGQHAGA